MCFPASKGTTVLAPDVNAETEKRAWIAYYDAQAALYAELAEAAGSAEECCTYREREYQWLEKGRNLRFGRFSGSLDDMGDRPAR